jgi:hypothetical protein
MFLIKKISIMFFDNWVVRTVFESFQVQKFMRTSSAKKISWAVFEASVTRKTLNLNSSGNAQGVGSFRILQGTYVRNSPTFEGIIEPKT